MNKITKLFALLLIAGIALTSCNNSTSDRGVEINGVRWATRNVDAPGTFAPRPESPGRFFQWNRSRGWSATEPEWDIPIDNWDNSIQECTINMWTGDFWANPCPTGWRAPTRAELQKLVDAGSISIVRNGIEGRLFGTAPNQIFLPFAGWRDGYGGYLSFVGSLGNYWSSTHYGNNYAVGLSLHSDDAYWVYGERVWIGSSDRRSGFNLRCVAESHPNRVRETNRAREASVPRLDERTVQFSENYFIALNLVHNYSHRSPAGPRYLRFQSIVDILRAVRAKGHTDIRRAYAVSDYRDSFRYIEDLGFDRNNLYLWIAFTALYSEPVNWRMPELQSTLIERLDNGTEIWRVRDFVTMHQARLSVSAGGDLSIGNVERFSLGD